MERPFKYENNGLIRPFMTVSGWAQFRNECKEKNVKHFATINLLSEDYLKDHLLTKYMHKQICHHLECNKPKGHRTLMLKVLHDFTFSCGQNNLYDNLARVSPETRTHFIES